ncbi:PEP-CTERM sorting domain-containing protein [Azohydromonas sp. G-1-1-14]|uniref:PEP-CTERM sorting domain-containing protein n=2 Tax=Azohydromonas caseinilytica TaxID=2728836 RepID=A0A848FFD3_9BURK|nr:PEP-CTERM sorting domain-containing protein [Azohydromonas caseinilytica]
MTVSPLPRVSERPTTFTVVDLNNENQLLASATIQGSDGQIRSGYVIYDDGRYRPLNPSGSIRGALTARAFNDQGAVVGLKFVGPNRDRAHAIVWRDGTTRDLNDFMAPDPSGATWELIDAWDINERGQIVGIGRLGDVTNARGFIATPVPEPGGWALLLAGLGVLGWKARRAGPARS